ncbi:ribonuclease E activity regulator RraA [Lentibacillus amyloliquefaciens]|uniref:4-hydroxy-4-methyl-2-oxoglutarate aldolase n=1 Tax=Lentibacillus amyloliquefaciens TaxID=1472767 RepID=A0A0U4FNF7_9BACI|nr:ribonuclease E activity regulator RraA [Lentibacillus amyloliquefaciens]ALX50190.1 ribonuclease [Lentibacillus amyloliquefaciens]
MRFKTTDLCDHYSNELSICKQPFTSYGMKKAFAGPISTVKVLEDNVLVEESLKTIPEGHLLIVDGGGSRECALMGDRLASIIKNRNLAGVIIYGCIRDSADIAQMDVGVLALGTSPLKSNKKREGEKDITLAFGEVEWKPGNFAYADEDGIVISERKLI